MLLDRSLQHTERKALQLPVEREREIASVLRRTDRFDVLYDAAETVLQDSARAGLAGELLLECELDAFLSGVIHAGESDHVRGYVCARIVAPELAMLMDALQAERGDRIRGVRGHLALEVGEIARAVVELFLQLARLQAEH